jgi:hypothetical protein
MPFSTLKECDIDPANQRRVSERIRETEATIRRIVHADPVCDFLRYEGFVFAVGGQLAGIQRKEKTTRTESIECLHAHALCFSKGILIEHCVLRVAIHSIHWEEFGGSFEALQTSGLPLLVKEW